MKQPCGYSVFLVLVCSSLWEHILYATKPAAAWTTFIKRPTGALGEKASLHVPYSNQGEFSL